jgi:FG-GAP-like repeat/FG-GAP repeat
MIEYRSLCYTNVIPRHDRSIRGRIIFLILKIVLSTALLAGVWSHSTPALAADPTFGARTLLGPGLDRTHSVAVGDLNGDGALDIVVGNYGQQSAVYWNNGAGDFTQSTPFGTDPGGAESVAVGDLNGDGALDIVDGNSSGQNVVYWNNGAGDFTQSTPFGTGSEDTRSVAVGDLNGDGALDIVVGYGYFAGHSQQNVVYWNNGTGSFATSTPFGTGSEDTRSVVVGDLNGDGALDIVVGNFYQQNAIYWNNGAGDFTQSTPFGTGPDWTESVAVGDLNGDGALDIVVGSGYNLENWEQDAVYWNDGVGDFTQSTPFGDGYKWTRGVMVGDLNGDGALDIVIGNNGQDTVYWNDGAGNFATTTPFGTGSEDTRSVAVGDLNGDGALDIIVGNWQAQNAVYWNSGAGNFIQSTSFGDVSKWTRSILVGDLNGDGALDIIVGDRARDSVYWNDGVGNFATSLPFGIGSDATRSVAVGDLNGDGALDIVVGNGAEQNVVYWNNGTGDFTQSTPFGTGSDWTENIMVGDLNGDGALDIVVGNGLEQNAIYWNDGAGDFATSTPFGTGSEDTRSVAVGDLNGDGALDIIVGNWQAQNVVYWNNGAGSFATSTPFGTGLDTTYSVAVGDLNDDGALDIVVGNLQAQNAVYWNNGAGSFATSTPFGMASDATESVAVGDLNGDGALDIVVGYGYYDGQGQQNAIYWNYTRLSSGLVNHSPFPVVQRPTTTHNAAFYSSPEILTSSVIPIAYTLFDTEGDPVGHIDAHYSMNGGGQWLPAVAASGVQTSSLSATPYPTVTLTNTHTFLWDTFASGLFGRNDNVVFRITALPLPPYTGVVGSYRYTNSIPGPYLWPYPSATTFPFRVRGSQVRVYQETVAADTQAAGAWVYRLPKDHTIGGALIGDIQGKALRTDVQGYLPGHGVIYPGDRLLALAPVSSSGQYTLYNISAVPVAPGLDDYAITQAGVQTLTVSAANPLLLFDLTVSLAWDASNEPVFQAKLEQDLVKASQALYDWSDGQVALGQITVYQAREHWDDADIRILASNQVRPNADQGGVVTEPTVITFQEPTAFTPGQVRIGPEWNRYGNIQPIGEDWSRALAHELAHYLLFLEDTYLGFDAQSGLLIPITTCTGTAMTDPYNDAFSEFRTDDASWASQCGATLAELPDWAAITRIYPELHAPQVDNPGPALMPYAFTQVEIKPPPAAAASLLNDTNIQMDDPTLKLADGQAYLIRRGAAVINLGKPVNGTVLARGAREGDELCVFAAQDFACQGLSNTSFTPLTPQSIWRPTIQLSPVNTTTLQLRVTDVGGPITAVLYPNGRNPTTITLQSGVTQTVGLSEPALNVLVDLNGDTANKRLIIGYAHGGGPGRKYSHGEGIASSDGGLVIFPPQNLSDQDFLSLQTVTTLPSLPAGWTSIGRAYEVHARGASEAFDGGSIAFQYLQSDVILSKLPEGSLTVHYWNGSIWQRLQTVLNQTQNIASAPLPGAGIYVLMDSIEIPLQGPGWNLFAYPVQGTKPVTEALQSIAGYYTTVYGYEPTDVEDPWKIYDVSVPAWVNDLHDLRFGQGYWISVTQAINLYLKAASTAAADSGLPDPPTTYYGAVLASQYFVPTAGMPVVAYVNGKPCGRGQTRQIDGQIVYVVDVWADGPGEAAGCGVLGAPVTFEIGSRVMSTTAAWDNTHVREVALDARVTQNSIYLPLVTR